MDPRFPGGTSSAVADEIPVLSDIATLSFVGTKSAMFSKMPVNTRLARTLDEAGLDINWDPKLVQADTIVVHNPSFLKFNSRWQVRLACDTLVVVCHENFLLPDGSEAFDIEKGLTLLDDAALCRRRLLAPVSAYNRKTITDWAEEKHLNWTIASEDWTNICAAEMIPPTATPTDRRGRHSRPGHEKFPRRAEMEQSFPPSADANVILGADHLIADDTPDHWSLFPFGGMSVTKFFDMIDFYVYFTNPGWRESFGRVLAEATAAGKLVITDPGTASTFGDGVIGASPDEVDGIIAAHVSDPARYQATVGKAQKQLGKFGPDAFLERVSSILADERIEA